MLKNQDSNYVVSFKYLKYLSLFFFSFFFFLFLYFSKQKNSKYSFFIEFNDANGITVGTPIRMRGIAIGVIQDLQLKLNSILVLATISSKHIIISKDSILETTQTGLLNESILDIMPVKELSIDKDESPLSVFCDSSQIICNNMYILGDRGLNYDDLVRSTTRISQRFDDPRFFYLFYTFLQQSVELTDSMSLFFKIFIDTFNIKNRQISQIFN